MNIPKQKINRKFHEKIEISYENENKNEKHISTRVTQEKETVAPEK